MKSHYIRRALGPSHTLASRNLLLSLLPSHTDSSHPESELVSDLLSPFSMGTWNRGPDGNAERCVLSLCEGRMSAPFAGTM